MTKIAKNLTVDPQATYLDIGRIGRPHGVRGAVHLHLFNPDTDIFDHTMDFRIYQPGKPAVMLHLAELRPAAGDFLAHFATIEDRAQAAALTHAVVSVNEAHLPAAAEDEFYLGQLIGAIVYDEQTGERCGVIDGLLQTHTELLSIQLDAGGNALVPIESDAIVQMGREAGKVVIRHVDDWRSA